MSKKKIIILIIIILFFLSILSTLANSYCGKRSNPVSSGCDKVFFCSSSFNSCPPPGMESNLPCSFGCSGSWWINSLNIVYDIKFLFNFFVFIFLKALD